MYAGPVRLLTPPPLRDHLVPLQVCSRTPLKGNPLHTFSRAHAHAVSTDCSFSAPKVILAKPVKQGLQWTGSHEK